jgi:hypothetical protein
MATIQELLDQEAKLSNEGHGKSEFRMIIHEEIKARRGTDAPHCWGEDDCSTNMLMRCPWRIDCYPGDR